MSDPRITPDPALVQLQEPAQVVHPVVDLCRSPDGPRDRQLLFGEAVTVLARTAEWAYVQAAKDAYCGHVLTDSLGARQFPTHTVRAPATHAYAAPNIKSPDQMVLSFGSTLSAGTETKDFLQTNAGYVPKTHLIPLGHHANDPAELAMLFLGTPYLWGGNSRWGIDCSGLVQAAFLACGIPCPGDSDQQQALGEDGAGPYQRNDLLFWKGHVALVLDTDTMVHANAHAMAVACEPIERAITRIAQSGDGPVTAHRRLMPS